MSRRWLMGASAVIAAVALSACASSSPAGRAGGSPSVARCERLPTSTGPLAALARLNLSAPATASAGQALAVSVTVTAESTMRRVVTTPASSGLLVLQGDRVVGRTLGARSAPPVPLQLAAGESLRAQAVPVSVRLTACGRAGSATALAPGSYTLVAVLGYQLDPLNAVPEGGTGVSPPTGARSFALVSGPSPLTID